MQHEDTIAGSLLGTAVGDALGLPLEGLSPQRARKLFGEIGDDLGMRLLFEHGLVSDDTEHAVLTLQAFVASNGDVTVFRNQLARRLKYWFLCLPPGTGLATAKSCLKLLLGASPERSGVLSAGNGPAMRAPILGVLLPDDAQLCAYIRASSRLTHTDPKAEYGSLAVALAARCASTQEDVSPSDFLTQLERLFEKGDNSDSKQELLSLVKSLVESVERGQSTHDFARAAGMQNGVSGYIYHTVPACLHAWLSHQNDYRKTVLEVLQCGGDADSTAAIVGGIVGARVGESGVPEKWCNAVSEWPRSLNWMRQLSSCAARGEKLNTPFWFGPATFLRNIFLLVVVLTHGLRRVLPPY